MANNLDIKDANLISRVIKTTDNLGVHVPHHNVDSLPVGQQSMSASTPVVIATDQSPIDVQLTAVAHGDADSGNPFKIGSRSTTAIITGLANGSRSDLISDEYGRLLTSHIPAVIQFSRQLEATTQQTGTILWTPQSGKKIAITNLTMSIGGTTPGLVTVWFGGGADNTFTYDTDQVVFRGEFVPTVSNKPGFSMPINIPIFCRTTDFSLRYTTSADMTIYITVYGYEF